MSPICQGQLTVNGRLCIRFLCTRSSGYIGVQRVCIVKRNEQDYARRNGIVSCGQRAVVGNNNGLVGNICDCCQRGIKPFVKSLAVCIVPNGILGKYRHNRHGIGRLQRKTCRLGNNRSVSRIDPTKEGNTALSNSFQRSTVLGRNLHLAAIVNSIAVHLNTAQATVILERNVRRLLRGNERKVTHNQFVFGIILIGCDDDLNAFTYVQRRLKCTACYRIRRTVNLQVVNLGGSPIKGNIGRRRRIVIDIDGSRSRRSRI